MPLPVLHQYFNTGIDSWKKSYECVPCGINSKQQPVTTGNHTTYMRRCLQIAEMAKGHTSPNPMVGAVLIYNDRMIGEGYHHYYGAPHAEVNCLDNVAAADKHLIPESTMYVSLEPCAHFGLTPPCATRLVTEGIKNVIIANPDPFGKVNGKGIAILQEAGASVTTGLLDMEGLWLNRRFFCAHTSKRPYIILKWAQTTDGFIGTTDRQSVQISGPESMLLSHQWRTEEAAIMVGYTTALNDNPRLTARLHTGKQPLRIALDRRLSLPHSHHLFNEDAATWIITEGEETISGNVHYINMPFSDLLPALMSRLYDAKMLSLIVEGGAQLLNSFITSGLWDEARVFTGKNSIGNGLSAPTLSNDLLVLDRSSGEDKLQVFLNKNNPYKYVTGMAL